jgi:hypothetical protein
MMHRPEPLPALTSTRYATFMPLLPEDWNVVVAGRWNTALFTPAAINRRIFKLPEGMPVEVLVVLDDVQMPRVKHEGMTVSPSTGKLVVSPELCSFDQLARAMRIAKEAVAALPNTPFAAAGFNLRYRSTELPQTVTRIFSNELDQRISDNDYEIIGRQFQRLLKFDAGRLLVQVARDPDGKAEFLMNFERRSRDAAQLQEWLSKPIEEVRQKARNILSSVLQLQEEDYVIERDDHSDEHSRIVAAGAAGDS